MVEGTCPSLSLVGGFILVASYGTGHVNVRAIQILEEWDTGVTPSLKPARKIWAFFSIGFCTEDLQFAKRSWTKIS